MNIFSEFRVIEFNGCTALHHILESANLVHVCATSSAEMARLGRFLNGVDLFADCGCHVIGLIFISSLGGLARSASLGQGPSGEVKLVGRV